MLNLNFISPTISEGDAPRPWTRFSDHIGPTEHVTPLGARISGKTYCGLLTLAAGLTGWCAHRLRGPTDVSVLVDLVEALFAYQNDWRYFDRSALPHKKAIDNPMELSTTVGVETAIRNIMFAKIFWKTGRIPDKPVFHLAHVIGYILPERELDKFETWIYAASDRLEEIAPRPHERVPPKTEGEKSSDRNAAIEACHGLPLPPEVLDVTRPFEIETRAELVCEFLKSLDWERNPFLATPLQMRESGFKGEPYVG